MKLRPLIVLLALAARGALGADTPMTQAVGPFGGLNTNISQEALDSSQSPDLLNVDVTQGGKSVKKRQGYGIDATFVVSTSPVHNLYKFFDSGGNEVRLAFNDNQVSSSINGAAWTTFLTTGTFGATWDCTDYLGFAYCVSSAFDNPIKTNGTLSGTTGAGGTNAVPAGSLISNSGDRLLVGATAANPSRLYYSQSAVFSNFALGIQPSDSSFEDIVAPGSKLTHLAYRFGRWLWWKDQSFGFIVGTGQFDLQIITVSNTIGTLDNTDVFDGAYVYFRGSDSQIYTYDGSTLSRSISIDISPTLRAINRRKANSWTQTTQSDFQAGSIFPAGYLSTTISPGDVTSSTFSAVENSSTSWATDVSSNLIISPSSFTLNTNNSGTVNDPSFENAQPHVPFFDDYDVGPDWNAPLVSGFLTWAAVKTETNPNGCNSVINPQSGTYFASGEPNGATYVGGPFFQAQLLDDNLNVLLTKNISVNPTCSWVQTTISSVGLIGRSVKLQFLANCTGASNPTDQCLTHTPSVLTSTSSYILGGDISFYYLVDGDGASTHTPLLYIDNIQNGVSSVTSGWILSKAYDTGISSQTVQIKPDFATTSSTPTFSVQTSTSANGVWTNLLSSSGTNAVANRYVRYSSTISVVGVTGAAPIISTITIVAASSGTYYSAVENAPNIAAWNTLGITDVAGSSIAYFTRSSTNSFSVLSSTPAWIQQSKNATVAASTGTFFQLRADFTVLNATAPPTLNDFTFNWYEGAAADKMYATYFNNGLWFSVSIGTTSSTNNRVFRYDLISNLWTVYDIPANGFAVFNNGLYFGDPAAGKIYQFGNGVTSDNGSPINAYWKSKAFFGDSPFNDKDLRLASWYIGESSGTSLNLNYTFDENAVVTKSISLFDTRRNVIQSNWNFPLGSIATNFNIQFGDNSTAAGWEVFGGVITGYSRPWKVYP